MGLDDYHFVTRWHMEAPVEPVYDLLGEPLRYQEWMKEIWIRVTSVHQGEPSGLGREDLYELRGFLPYRLRWTLRCIAIRRPYGFTSLAAGDLEGKGTWSFQPVPGGTEITFDWQVALQKPALRPWALLLRPVFKWNHDWVMEKWKKNLERELKRSLKIAPTL